MKNILLFQIIFVFIFSACSDFSGNEDAVEASLKPGPKEKKVKKDAEEEDADTRTWYHLYGITFGDNTFVAVGYKGAIRTSSDNGSSWDNGTSGTTKYFNEVVYGDSTFIAVGESGKIITSSDNGSSWDNSTQAQTTAALTGVAFGDDVGIAVASTDILRSRNDNGSNWVRSNTLDKMYDVVFGNRTASGEVATCGTITHGGDHNNGTYTSVALSGGSGSGAQATVIVSGDNVTSVSITHGGTGLYQIGDVLTIDNATIGGDDNATCRVATVTVTSKVFVGVGDDGKVCYSTNYKDNTETWSCPQEIVDDKQLYGITYGNNKFIAVGESGTVIRSDNGTNWTENLSGNSNTSANLYSIVFGNDRFVAVGRYAVIVSTNNGDSFTLTETNYIFKDISFGNGVFVAVGSDEIIYTSTGGGLSDGDTWTKVHGKP